MAYLGRSGSSNLPAYHPHSIHSCGSSLQNFASRLDYFLEHGMMTEAREYIQQCEDARVEYSLGRYGHINQSHQNVIMLINFLQQFLYSPQILAGRIQYYDNPMRFIVTIYGESYNTAIYEIRSTGFQQIGGHRRGSTRKQRKLRKNRKNSRKN